MSNVTPITERFQHFLAELRETFWGDLYGQTQQAWKAFLEAQSERERKHYLGFTPYERSAEPKGDSRNGYYERNFVTRLARISHKR